MARYKQGLCQCGNKQTSAGRYKGRQIFHKYCHSCKDSKHITYVKKDHCEWCGFIPVIMDQLDKDHIDGNKANNADSNFQTLCANCHRLKSALNKDYLGKTAG